MRETTRNQGWERRAGIGLGMLLTMFALTAARPAWSTPGPALDLNTVNAGQGGTANITVTITRNGNSVAGTSNDIGFDSANLSIAPDTDCTINNTVAPGFTSAFNKVCSNGSGMCTGDADCTGGNTPPCNIVRLGVFHIPTALIPSDGVLVTCVFSVSPTAPLTTYPLTNTPASADGASNPIAGTTGTAGSIIVVAQSPTPTNTPIPNTPTNTPVPNTPTNTPVPNTPTNTPIVSTPTNTATPTITPTITPTAQGGCESAPRALCQHPLKSSSISLVNATNDNYDSVRWSWYAGSNAVALSDFGNPVTPTGSTSYSFCIYDTTSGVPHIALGAYLAAGGICGTAARPRACWKKYTNSYTYTNTSGPTNGLPNGVKRVTLAQTVTARSGARITVSGRSANLAMPTPVSTIDLLEQDQKVIVQLQRNDDPACWESVFNKPAVTNTAKRFRDTCSPASVKQGPCFP